MYLTVLSVSADDIADSFHAESVVDGLSPDTQDLLQDYTPKKTFDFASALQSLISHVITSSVDAIVTGKQILLILVTAALAWDLTNADILESGRKTFLFAGCFAITAIMLQKLITSGSGITAMMQEMETFYKLLLPVMSSTAAASGAVVSAGILYAGSIFLFSILTALERTVLLPLIYCRICLHAGNCLMDDSRLSGLAEVTAWIFSAALKGMMYVFTAYISITGILGSGSDAAANKAAKAAIATAVPLVGGILSDASGAVVASAQLLKTSVGAYGMLAVIAIALNPFWKTLLYYLALKAAGAAISILPDNPTEQLVKGFTDCMGGLLAIIGSQTVMILISLCCFMKAVSGG